MISPDLARIRTFDVAPTLPESLKPLLEVAYNLWWTWHPEAVDLFTRLDRQLWSECHHNPVLMLGRCSQDILEEAARDDGFIDSLRRVIEARDRHMTRMPWHQRADKADGKFTIAYFCAEFGLTECLQIYSGGLGCLAGDHLKSASELALPLVGVGLLYRRGYFQQYLNADGWQQEYNPDLDFANLPLKQVNGDDGEQVKVSVRFPGRDVTIALWQVDVGRIPLYLLDTNLPENSEADREITAQLYGGDMEHRMKQELVLGIGGTRALRAIGITPDVNHMNEGHSAFLALERIRNVVVEHGLSFDEANRCCAAGNVFTTHTPVPAGIDRFPAEMMLRYFKDYVGDLKLDTEGLLALGRENVYNKNEFFSMAVLAIRTSDWANGVSKLHGQVSRDMWSNIWTRLPEQEVPINHVTNGVHARSWLSGDLTYTLDRYLGARWQFDPVDQSAWQGIHEVPDEELWRVHERRRQKLIVWARRRMRRQLQARGTEVERARQIADALDPSALTIGFARRFATYKRGNLLLRDPQRLLALLADTEQPIQFIIAGKAHPADGGGKDIIRQLVHFARDHKAAHKLVFIENYDIHVARYLVQGCDVWLNNPRRGMEASGTSGMKAAINGVINCSIMDGWWDEAYEPDLGWQIGKGEDYANLDHADNIEGQALYDLIEKQILPEFYDRDEYGIPRRWVARMKQCIGKLAPVYNTNRMVQEYAEKLYFPAQRRSAALLADGMKPGIQLAHMVDRLRNAWSSIRILDVKAGTDQTLGVRDELQIKAVLDLGDLSADDVKVQAYAGVLDNDGRIADGAPLDLSHSGGEAGKHVFEGAIATRSSGKHGFAIRVVPGSELLSQIHVPGLILWESSTPPQTAKTTVKEAVA